MRLSVVRYKECECGLREALPKTDVAKIIREIKREYKSARDQMVDKYLQKDHMNQMALNVFKIKTFRAIDRLSQSLNDTTNL
jgi:hypothetical protein